MKRSILKSIPVITFLLLLIAGCSTKKEDDGKIQITTSSDEARADFLKGRELFENLKGTESLKYFENAIAKDGNFALAYYYHALSNPTAKGFFEDVDKAVSLAGKASEGERMLIFQLQAGTNGDQKKQEDTLLSLVDKFPKDERAHTQLGTFYFGIQDYQKAADHLKKSTEIDSAFAPAYNMLGYSYRNLGNYNDADAAFKKYIELIPGDPNPYDSYAEMLMKEGKYEESIQQYKKALSVDSNFVPSFVGIATNYNFLGKHDEARMELQKYYNMARNDGEKRAALFAMAVSYIDEGNFPKALEEMNQQLQMGEKINDAAAITGDYQVIGNILFEMGKYDEAKTNYDKALQTSEASNLSAEVKDATKRLDLYNQGRIALMKGDLSTAKEKSKEFTEQAAAANNIFQIWLSHDLAGMIALKEKDYNKAEDEFKKSSLQNPYTFYRLALAMEGKKDKEGAKNYYKMAGNFNSLNNMNQAFIRSKSLKLAMAK
ncbi:MAG TPA: tetratricopeptide repeat protein [Ignavibacteriaceae bacterium]|nr:tetratricopeptide repeat protein [Ignavibacteriaceae bacterium]